MHHRFAPKAHRFDYRIFLFGIDLDELDTLQSKLRLFSVDRLNAYSFRQQDFFPSDTRCQSLRARLVAHLAERKIDVSGGRVMLLTLPRVFGYLFNPVSFYFCYDRTGAPVTAIAEVTNTFREMKPFVLGPGTCTKGNSGITFSLRVPKNFYVSPFTDTDVSFDFTLRVPAERLSVQIDDYDHGKRTLTSVLSGTRCVLTDARLAWFSIKYPLITLRIIILIHWHALILYLKKIPWFAKAARPETQRDLYRPHLSIATPPKA